MRGGRRRQFVGGLGDDGERLGGNDGLLVEDQTEDPKELWEGILLPEVEHEPKGGGEGLVVELDEIGGAAVEEELGGELGEGEDVGKDEGGGDLASFGGLLQSSEVKVGSCALDEIVAFIDGAMSNEPEHHGRAEACRSVDVVLRHSPVSEELQALDG